MCCPLSPPQLRRGGAEPSIKKRATEQGKQTNAPSSSALPPSHLSLSSFHLLPAQALPCPQNPSLRNSSPPPRPPSLPNSHLPGGAPSPEAAGSRGGGGAPANARAPLRLFLVIIYYYYLPLPVAASLVWVDRGSVYLSIGLVARLVLGKIGVFFSRRDPSVLGSW
jgi:hypothetical protein